MPRSEKLIELYERELRDVLDCADNTVRAYTREIASLKSWLAARDKTLLTAKRDDFIDYKASLDRAPNGIAMAIKAARSFYGFLEDQNFLAPSPFPLNLKVKVKKQEPTDVPTAAQFLAMRVKLDAPVSDPRAVPADIRRAVVEVLAGSGLRIEALLTLKPRHLRLGTRPIILVDAEDMSCKGKIAGEVPLSAYAAALLQAHLDTHKPGWDDPVFQLSQSMVRKILDQIQPADLNLKPHSLRHFYCSMTYYRNFDGGRCDAVWVRDAAGHGSISTTDNYLKLARRICQSDAEWEAWTTGKPLAQSGEQAA